MEHRANGEGSPDLSLRCTFTWPLAPVRRQSASSYQRRPEAFANRNPSHLRTQIDQLLNDLDTLSPAKLSYGRPSQHTSLLDPDHHSPQRVAETNSPTVGKHRKSLAFLDLQRCPTPESVLHPAPNTKADFGSRAAATAFQALISKLEAAASKAEGKADALRIELELAREELEIERGKRVEAEREARTLRERLKTYENAQSEYRSYRSSQTWRSNGHRLTPDGAKEKMTTQAQGFTSNDPATRRIFGCPESTQRTQKQRIIGNDQEYPRAFSHGYLQNKQSHLRTSSSQDVRLGVFANTSSSRPYWQSVRDASYSQPIVDNVKRQHQRRTLGFDPSWQNQTGTRQTNREVSSEDRWSSSVRYR
ncbi:hypothetical protein BJ742DRAFT_842911 [Cladochytrium replicatum]|nr:hypothetical protein BJ742DRAFT_842911 [Cladochytrium replicatum]